MEFRWGGVKSWMTTQWFRGKLRWEVLWEPTVERVLKDLLERLLKEAAEVPLRRASEIGHQRETPADKRRASEKEKMDFGRRSPA